MATAFIGLGSNLGERAGFLKSALDRIGRFPKTKIIRCSSWHETDPVGGPPQEKFLNGVARIETQLKPADLLDRLQLVEEELGRPREHDRNGPRVIDLDLLDYDNLGVKTRRLELPHPRMQERLFVLLPLAEIEPEWKHPILEKTAKDLLSELSHA